MKLLPVFTALSVLFSASFVFAEPSSEHTSQASKHLALALSHGSVGSVQVASGVIAVPLVVVGSVAVSAAQTSIELGGGMSKVASSELTHSIDKTPVVLEVTEITITVDRAPDQAIKE